MKRLIFVSIALVIVSILLSCGGSAPKESSADVTAYMKEYSDFVTKLEEASKGDTMAAAGLAAQGGGLAAKYAQMTSKSSKSAFSAADQTLYTELRKRESAANDIIFKK